jgi:hypothetical protein
MIGAFLFALDTTIVNIAIPKIMTSISADLNQNGIRTPRARLARG